MSTAQLESCTALEALLAPIDGAGPRPDAVVRRLCAAVDLGVMVDGAQLPVETDLATQFGVSTVTLREALAVLRQQGLVRTRRGRGGGSFINASARAVNTNALTRLRQLSSEDLRDLGDEYLAVTGATAALAARRCLPADIARLRALVASMQNTTDLYECRQADSRFHVEVAVSSRSRRLTRAEIRLQAELSVLIWLPEAALDPVEESAANRELVDAIENRDSTRARELAQSQSAAHMRRLIEIRAAVSS